MTYREAQTAVREDAEYREASPTLRIIDRDEVKSLIDSQPLTTSDEEAIESSKRQAAVSTTEIPSTLPEIEREPSQVSSTRADDRGQVSPSPIQTEIQPLEKSTESDKEATATATEPSEIAPTPAHGQGLISPLTAQTKVQSKTESDVKALQPVFGAIETPSTFPEIEREASMVIQPSSEISEVAQSPPESQGQVSPLTAQTEVQLKRESDEKATQPMLGEVSSEAVSTTEIPSTFPEIERESSMATEPISEPSEVAPTRVEDRGPSPIETQPLAKATGSDEGVPAGQPTLDESASVTVSDKVSPIIGNN